MGLAAQEPAATDAAGMPKCRRASPAKVRDNGWGVARAVGQLSSRLLGGKTPTLRGEMRTKDEIRAVNEQHWARMVREGCGFTRPWLNLNRDLLRQYVEGQLDPVPAPLLEMYPVNVLVDIEDKKVLCLASGSG